MRPENYPMGLPGKGYCFLEVKGIVAAVLNLEGRIHLSNIRCPFAVGDEIIKKLNEKTNIIIIDFHAEWPEEKEALALYMDGRISALAGTHTHVQTGDERILPHGTGYITDIGMTGSNDSVIGMDKEVSIERCITQMPLKLYVVDKPSIIMGVIFEIDIHTGKTVSIHRLIKESVV